MKETEALSQNGKRVVSHGGGFLFQSISFIMSFHRCCWQFWWMQLLISMSLAWHGILHWTMPWAGGWVCWVIPGSLRNHVFVIPLGSKKWVSLWDLPVEDTDFHLSRVSQPVYPRSSYGIRVAPRGIPKHCSVLYCFLFKSVVGIHFQLLLQVCSTFFKQSAWSSSHLGLISTHASISSGSLQGSAAEEKGHWQVREGEGAPH